MADTTHRDQLQVNDPCFQIRCALDALEPLSDLLSYKACTHLHRALLILDNFQDKEEPTA